jgi:hypothetical protein
MSGVFSFYGSHAMVSFGSPLPGARPGRQRRTPDNGAILVYCTNRSEIDSFQEILNIPSLADGTVKFTLAF